MSELWQVLFNGLGIGGVYAIVAVGIQLVIGVSKVPNFANGQYYMFGGYALYLLLTYAGIGYFPSFFFSILIVAGIGALSERTAIRPLLEKARSSGLLSTLGLGMFFEGVALLIFGASPKSINTEYARMIFSIGGVYFSMQRVFILIGAFASFLALDLFIMKSKIGKGLRAMSQNKEACRLFGIDIYKMSLISFTIGTALAAFAAGLTTPLSSVSPFMGTMVIFKAFAVIIVAGVGEIRGVMVSAVVLGLAESLGAFFIDPLLKDATAFLFMIVILLVRPQGLFGEKRDLLFQK